MSLPALPPTSLYLFPCARGDVLVGFEAGGEPLSLLLEMQGKWVGCDSLLIGHSGLVGHVMQMRCEALSLLGVGT